MGDRATIVSVHAVGMRYRGGDRDVLAGIDLVVHAGESVAIVGPSGSGKTTLLSIIGRLVAPRSGRVVWHRDDAALPVAWVTQTTNALGHRSTLDNVVLAARAAGKAPGPAHEIARTMLAEVGLGDRADLPARRLSGGELQRLCIARALVSGSPLVLADEPTGQLDTTTTTDVIGLLTATADDTTALVCVTHDPQVAAACDRRLHLADGRLTELGP